MNKVRRRSHGEPCDHACSRSNTGNTVCVQKGIKLFGECERNSVKSELQQLHNMITFIPVHAHKLTHEQQKQALASLMFMTEKNMAVSRVEHAQMGASRENGFARKRPCLPL